MSSSNPRYWFALHPDVDSPIGGVKQAHRLCECLSSLGRKTCIIQDDASFHPSWFSSSVDTISVADFSNVRDLNASSDIVILPETYMNVFSTYAPGLSKIVFNQNCSYTFGIPPNRTFPSPVDIFHLYRHPDLLSVLCVSRYDQEFLLGGLCLDPSNVNLLVNPVETDLFCLAGKKFKHVAFMPRKNSFDARIVSSLLSAQPWWQGWKFVPIANMSQAEVSLVLQQSLVFLSFGHPEGFGLPAAEALACGCYLIGYNGLGGRELFELGSVYNAASEIQYGDWQGFIDAMRRLDSRLSGDSRELLDCLEKSSFELRSYYNLPSFRRSVEVAFSRIEKIFFSRK